MARVKERPPASLPPTLAQHQQAPDLGDEPPDTSKAPAAEESHSLRPYREKR